jgi:hypothetical protein
MVQFTCLWIENRSDVGIHVVQSTCLWIENRSDVGMA